MISVIFFVSSPRDHCFTDEVITDVINLLPELLFSFLCVWLFGVFPPSKMITNFFFEIFKKESLL